MSVIIYTKDVGEVRDVYRRECECVKINEDRIEDYRKINDMGFFE